MARLGFMLTAAQAALGKLGMAVAKHSKYALPDASARPTRSNNLANMAIPGEFVGGKEVCRGFLRGRCNRTNC